MDFEYPSDREIRKYLHDKLDKARYNDNKIEQIVAFYVRNRQTDLFADEEISVCFAEDNYNEIIIIGFWIKDSTYDVKNDCSVISADKLNVKYDEEYDKSLVEKAKQLVPEYLAVKKVRERNLHYRV